MNDDFPENFSRILFNSSWEMEAIFILIIGICLQNTLRVEKERWAASNIQELDWHSQLDYVTLPVDTVFRTQCQEGVLYPSWIRVARLIIKLTQDRLTLSWQWAPLVLFTACSPIMMMMSLFTLLLSLLLLLSGDLCSGVELPVTDGSFIYWTALCRTIPLPFWVYIETGCFSNKGSLITICQCTW